MTMLSKYFSLAEMTKSQTATRLGLDNIPSDGQIDDLKDLCINILDPVREHYGVPFSPSSGYRSPELNAAIGSTPTSQHCAGQAADIEVPGVSNIRLAWWIRVHLDFDQLILEYYTSGDPSSGWIHVSLNSGSNRHKVLTYNGTSYEKGLPE
tara:strand:- start:8807 stop:9262 length:456 start_codon:yes stop_codon:yes gene_type:complete